MSLYLRGRIWWCRVQVLGKVFQFSTKLTNRNEAAKWEAEKIASLRNEQSTRRVYEKIQELTVKQNLSFPDAFKFFEAFPRARTPGANKKAEHARIWRSFSAFAAERGITSVSAVTEETAVDYSVRIRTDGRVRSAKLSAATVNSTLATLKMIFAVLVRGKYCVENPFANIERMPRDEVPREIFTEDELRRMGRLSDHDVYPVVIVGASTGLRLVDICNLKWDNYDSRREWLSGVQHKTGQPYGIPVLPGLAEYLHRLEGGRAPGKYIFPKLADLYGRNPEAISRMFKDLLREAGVEGATKKVAGRDRIMSVKDIHSLRHTFAYIAGMHNIPLAVVQGILGHMTPAMTRHYMAHATDEDKRRYLQAIPDVLTGRRRRGLTVSRVIRMVEKLTPENCERWQRRVLKVLDEQP